MIPFGQGSLSIGTKELSKGKYDIWVEKDDQIDWEAFDKLFTGYGQQHKEKYPYGDWPRFFYYSGNDIGFIKWSEKRKIEEFHWITHSHLNVDLKNSNIARLFIHVENNKIELSIGEQTSFLALSGHLENISIKECQKIPILSFTIENGDINKYYQIPFYQQLEKATCLKINNSPQNQPFNCECLLQYPYLKTIELMGNMIHLQSLSKLKNLEYIALRYIPDLHDMPNLSNFKNLKTFIGYNIEEEAGKSLRKQLKKIYQKKEMDYTSITHLRKKIWFMSEYGIPFSGWEEKNAKIATKAYKKCFHEIKKSKTEDNIKKSIADFIQMINHLDNIETTERLQFNN